MNPDLLLCIYLNYYVFVFSNGGYSAVPPLHKKV